MHLAWIVLGLRSTNNPSLSLSFSLLFSISQSLKSLSQSPQSPVYSIVSLSISVLYLDRRGAAGVCTVHERISTVIRFLTFLLFISSFIISLFFFRVFVRLKRTLFCPLILRLDLDFLLRVDFYTPAP